MPMEISALRRDEQTFADPSARRRRSRNRRRRGPQDTTTKDARDEKSEDAHSSNEDVDADERYDHACAALLKLRRVSRFVLAAGGDDAVIADSDDKDSKKKGSDPEDIVPWLDARLLDKNVPPLYQAGLRPEHVAFVVDTMALERGRVVDVDGKYRARNWGVWDAFREDVVVRSIVEGESARRRGNGSPPNGVVGEELSETKGPATQRRTQTGPWNKR